jgi:hypothetical protein
LLILQSCIPISIASVSAGKEQVIDAIMIDRWIAQEVNFNKIIEVDPAISVLGIPMPGHHTLGWLQMEAGAMNRALRIYMPRNYQQLIDERDLIILREAAAGSIEYPEIYFDAKWMSWFVRAVREEGRALTMWGGDASWGGQGEGAYTSWGDTILDEILPFVSLKGYNPVFAAPHSPYFLDPNHPLGQLPWKDAGPIELLNKVALKPGATLVAKAVGGGREFPWISTWESGNGLVLGEAQVFDSLNAEGRMWRDWDWYQDFLILLTYMSVGKPLPEDIIRAHRIREEIGTHLSKSSMLISLLEFIENFGANTLELYNMLEDVNELEKVAEEHYLMDEYEKASDVFEEVHEAWNGINVRAAQVKKNALIWVYTIEWLAILGTSLFTGTFLWVVLTRRRLYHEVESTRMSRE